MMIKLIILILFLIGAFLEFFKIELKSLKISFRKGDYLLISPEHCLL